MSFYRAFKRNCPIKTIDGYDGTSTVDCFENIVAVGS